jgi:hypothetical protein
MRTPRSVFFLCPVLALNPVYPALADDDHVGPLIEPFEEPSEDQPVDIGSLLRFESAFGTADDRVQKVEAVFEPQIRIDICESAKLVALGRARADALDRLEPGRPSQDEVSQLSRRALIGDRVDLALREFYFDIALGRAALSAGKQQVVWGKADGLKVLDVVNPQSFREFILEEFSDSRIPLWSTKLEVPIDPVVVDVVWTLDQTYHEFPESGSVFAFTSPRFVPTPPAGVPVAVGSVKRPRRVIADSDAGLRVSTLWEGWDLALSYFYHYDDSPVFTQRLSTVGGTPTVIVTPEHRRTHLVGGTFSNAFGNLTVRGEAGLFLGRSFSTTNPRRSVARSDELDYVIGLDWYGINETLVSFQLFQSYVFDDEPTLLRDRTDTTITLLLRREMLNDALALEAMWLHGVKRGDGLVRPKISYQLNDYCTVWVGADVFYGGAGGLFGQFDANDRVVLGVEWEF